MGWANTVVGDAMLQAYAKNINNGTPFSFYKIFNRTSGRPTKARKNLPGNITY